MMSCIAVLYISVSCSVPPPPVITRWHQPDAPVRLQQTDTTALAPDPDGLYAERENLASATRAAGIWADRLRRDPQDFESAWKLARARYWLGGRGPERERRALLEEGIAAGRSAVAIEPYRPEGYFWIAANMGALAESHGLRQGIRYRGEIRSTLLKVLDLDPGFQQGSADRALGRWYYKVPGLFGGSNRKSEEHLRKSLTYNPDSTISRYFLAETLIDLNRKDEARSELQKVLDAPIDPEWAPEDREFKAKARRLLATLALNSSYLLPPTSYLLPPASCLTPPYQRQYL